MDTGVPNRYWATMPKDCRFDTIQELLAHKRAVQNQCREAIVPWSSLNIVEDAGTDNLCIVGQTNNPALLTHWTTKQLANYANFPAEPLTKLSSRLAGKCLMEVLEKERPTGNANLLVRENGASEVRCVTTEVYQRLWDSDLTDMFEFLMERGWMNPPAWPYPSCPESEIRITQPHETFEGSLVKVGDKRAPAGLYDTKSITLAFLIHPNSYIRTPQGRTMWRGLMIQNSEVRASACKATGFLFDQVCGNHNLFGAQELFEFNFRHTGDIRSKLVEAFTQLREFASKDMRGEQEIMDHAAKSLIHEDKTKITDVLTNRRSLGLSMKLAKDAVTIADTGIYGDPRSPWAISQALTQLSQKSEYAADRAGLDRQATQVLTAF